MKLIGSLQRLTVLTFFLAAHWTALWAGTLQAVEVSASSTDSVALSGHFSVFEDRSASMTAAQVLSQAVQDKFQSASASPDGLNFGYSTSAYWLQLRLRNSSTQTLERMLSLGHTGLSHVSLYQLEPDGAVKIAETGEALPFDSRAYPSRKFVFPLALHASDDVTLMLRIQSQNSLIVPATLWKPAAFHADERDGYLGFAWYFGMATAMIVFNLLLFIALREPIYLLYVTFVGCFAFGLAAGNGLAQQYLWPHDLPWPEIAVGLGFAMSLSFFLLFSRHMLNSQAVMPRFDKYFKVLIGFSLLMPMGLLVAYPQFVERSLLLQMVVSPLVIGAGIYSARKGQRSALFFLAAFSALVLFGLATALRSLGLVPANFLTINGAQIGSAMEMLLLAFALADRFNEVRKERVHAQAEALAAEQRMVETLRTSERLLESRVHVRTAELSATIDRLQQTQQELVQAEKLASLGALVAGVAHELNTPIGNALTVATTLEESATQFRDSMQKGELRKSALTTFVDAIVPMAELIARSCLRAATLIGSFKQVAVDQTSEQRRKFDLHDLIEDNITALRPSFRNAPWKIEIDIPTDIECNSYPGPLGQVVANLVQNAMSHAFQHRSAGTLKVNAMREGDTVSLVFADDGVGMEPDVLKHIFAPFFTTRLGQGGSGLGLSISLNIVTGVLGGTLQAQSQPGQGSTFTVTFPLNSPV